MLDDLKKIHQLDASDALGIAANQAAQLTHQFEQLNLAGEYGNVVYAGMGGSALSALLSQSWPACTVPFIVIRDYTLPAYIGPQTLVVVSSYSGNTEEAMSALEQATDAGCKVVVLASGGQLIEVAKTRNLEYLLLPTASQPRFAALYMFNALMTVLASAQLIDRDSVFTGMSQSAEFLSQSIPAWLPEVPTAQNPAKKLALELAGKSVVIYAGPKLAPVAYKWKISCNENAKQLAWWNQYPELNHNEFLGWTEQPVQKPYAVVLLASDLEHPRVQRRFEVTERLLSGKKPAAHIVRTQGRTLSDQMFWGVAFGDFVSLYLAILNNLDPTPVTLIETFKKSL